MSKKAKFLTLALFCGCFLVANQASAASAVKPIYSMAVSGNITLNKTEGYARIILTDAQGKEYLIYEASGPFDSGSFSFENTCEETCVLNGIVPKKVDVEVLGAEIHIDKLFMIEDRTAMNARVQTMGMQTYREALGPVQEDIKIAKINQYIENSGMKWTAGKTSVSGYSYEQKKHLFISVEGTNNETPNTQGIEYYTGGIFEMAGANASPKSASASASALPSSFDWRDRHGENWMTTIKSQGECGSCWIFATTAAIEGLTNLYFNKHINIDLSEQDVLSCLYPNYDGCNLGSTQSHTISSMNYFEAFGITQERCFLYSAKDLPCENKCGNWEDYLVTSDYGEREDMLNNADIIKRKLIENGPLSVSIPYMGHAMALVGYETDPDNPTTAPIWIYKNSWGENHGEQGYLRTSFTGAEIHSIGIPIKIADNPTIEINCVDKDNDNYCNWGISEEKPSTCPASCGPKKDCDDSNSDLGTFDSNYSCIPIGVIEGDELPPVVGKIPQTNIYINVPIELSFPVSDNKRVAGCKIMVKTPNSTSFYEFETTNFSKAPCLVCYAVAENVVLTEISIITPTPYQISVYGRCWDEAGNVSTGDITEINVLSSTNPPPIIEPEFSVGKITPSTAQLNVRKRFSTMVSDDGEVLACALKINNTPVEYMNFSESPCNDCTASVDYTFTSRGSYSVLARCLDNDGNAKEGEPVNISIGQNCPDCHANNTDRCETPPKCEKDCGADSQCDEKERNSSWTSSGNTCNGCGNGCNYSIDTQKPEAYKLINDDCYYGCSVSCGSNGWIKLYSSLVCSINSCPITKTSGNTCYSLRGCGIGGCTYLNADTNKGCSQSVCAESGWNNSACSQYNKELYITEGFNNSDDYISGYLFCDSDHLIVSGDCVPDDNNDKIISNWQTGSRGWFCEFECNGWCTADGTIKITCKP